MGNSTEPPRHNFFRSLEIEDVSIDEVRPNPNHSRIHSDAQICKLVASIKKYGLVAPLVVDGNCMIIAGHGVWQAAKKLSLATIPVVRITDLSMSQVSALSIFLNRVAEDSTWDREQLAVVFNQIIMDEPELEITETGFETAEIDQIILEYGAPGVTQEEDAADTLPQLDASRPVTTVLGDVWLLGRHHRLICGSALEDETYTQLMNGKKARQVVSDLPYNVQIEGNVSGLGKNKHGEFVQASGEMSDAEFSEFLSQATELMVKHSLDGSVHHLFMDWRGIALLVGAGLQHYDALINICVWAKSNGGMGSLYRSQHEMIAVFKSGKSRHINNVMLGKHGRNRTNVWNCPGVNAFGKNRDALLAMHPTVKPVTLITDAIKDCSKHKDIILDPFAGSGTVFLAAERCGRVAYGIELDPRYVDVALQRYKDVTGTEPVHEASGFTFSELS